MVQRRAGREGFPGTGAHNGSKWPPKIELLFDAARLGRLLLTKGVPPLDLEDVIPIVGLEIAAFRLVPALPPRERINGPAHTHCEILGINLAAQAHPFLARATRFWPHLIVPDHDDLNRLVEKRYLQWIVEVLTPALAGSFCRNPDLSDRGRAVKKWHERHFAMTMRPDFHLTAKRLEAAYFDSYGTPRSDKNKPGRFQGITPTQEKRVRGAQGCLELLHKLEAPGENLFVIEDGRLTVSQKSATQELKSSVGADKRMPSKIKLRPKLPRPSRQEVPTEAVEALQALRDLRDERDLPRTHPQLHMLSQAIESLAAKGNPEAPRHVAYLGLLVQRVEREQDPSLKAALVYEGLGGNKDQQDPRMSRGAVAMHYKVTARKIETHGPQARLEVERLMQLAS